jgi:hypothetical protein
MGFDIDKVVEAFNFVGIDRNDGQDYELEEAYMGDITARLLGEPWSEMCDPKLHWHGYGVLEGGSAG